MGAAKRRRRQFAIGFTHLARIGRPIYKKKSKERQAKQLARVIANERRIKQKTRK